MGRPKSLIKRVKTNFFIREDIAEWLKTNRPQGAHVERALDQYIKRLLHGQPRS